MLPGVVVGIRSTTRLLEYAVRIYSPLHTQTNFVNSLPEVTHFYNTLSCCLLQVKICSCFKKLLLIHKEQAVTLGGFFMFIGFGTEKRLGLVSNMVGPKEKDTNLPFLWCPSRCSPLPPVPCPTRSPTMVLYSFFSLGVIRGGVRLLI